MARPLSEGFTHREEARRREAAHPSAAAQGVAQVVRESPSHGSVNLGNPMPVRQGPSRAVANSVSAGLREARVASAHREAAARAAQKRADAARVQRVRNVALLVAEAMSSSPRARGMLGAGWQSVVKGHGAGIGVVPSLPGPGQVKSDRPQETLKEQDDLNYWFDSGHNIHHSDMGIHAPGTSQNPTGHIGPNARPGHPGDVYGVGKNWENQVSPFFGEDGNSSSRPYEGNPSGAYPRADEIVGAEKRARMGLGSYSSGYEWDRNL